MLVPNESIDERALAAMLAEQYEVAVPSLDFEAVGADSWNYRADSLWVSVRRDFEGHVPACYEAAIELRDQGLDFVLAPLTGRDRCVVHTVGRYPVIVSRHLDVRPLAAGGMPTRVEREAVAAMADRLHTSRVRADVPVEDFGFPLAQILEEALHAAAFGVPAGPFGGRLRSLVVGCRHAIAELADELRRLGRARARAGHSLVLTHGDLAPGNVLRHRDGLLLADWTGAMWAPRERDWFHLERTFRIRAAADPELVRYYQVRWALTEIAEYVTHLAAPHAGTIDDEIAWRELLISVPGGRRAAMVLAT